MPKIKATHLSSVMVWILMLALISAPILLAIFKPLWLFLGVLIAVLFWFVGLFFRSWPYSLYAVLIGFWLGG